MISKYTIDIIELVRSALGSNRWVEVSVIDAKTVKFCGSDKSIFVAYDDKTENYNVFINEGKQKAVEFIGVKWNKLVDFLIN